ncbi:hypothetical protein SprV_0301162100 [Sparganum proliferum]
MHPGGLLRHRQAEECVGHQEAVFSAGPQEKEVIVIAAGDSVRTQHSPPSSAVCPDADIEVTKTTSLSIFDTNTRSCAGLHRNWFSPRGG